VQRLLPAGEVQQAALELAQRIAALAPQAARLNKRTLREVATSAQALDTGDAYAWAASAEHREGIQAFLQKCTPQF
ncbi:MAG: enoyl-CoA hydratase/isomerase family protein, partial [Ottowia sp.]|nr:enoyl-CoA hydratase/isomerase family protein [Ottowia sp.]